MTYLHKKPSVIGPGQLAVLPPHPSNTGARLRSVLKRLTARSGPVWFVSNGRRVPVKLLGAFDGTDGERLCWEIGEAVGQGPIELVFFGPSAGYQTVLESHSERQSVSRTCVTSVPTEFEPLRFRRDPRFIAPSGVYLKRTSAPCESLQALHTLSDRGLSFLVERQSEGVEVGDEFDADISWMGALRIRLQVTACHLTACPDGRKIEVGASIRFFTSEDESRWHDQVDAVRHGLTRAGKLFTRDMWELFESAGYFGLSQKQSCEFVQHRAAFEQASKLISARPELGVQVVFPSARGIEATASVLAESEQTAVIYHVAKRRGDDPRGIPGKTVLRSVYEHALTWATRRNVQWVSAWVQDVTNFSCGLHRDFAAAHSASGNAGVFTFRALEIAARADAVAPAGFTVRAATERELESIVPRFHVRYPHPIPQARGWTESELRVDARPARSAPRERRVTVAIKDGRIRAAAILECALPGVHLFGIFDSCYVVQMDRDAGAIDALLADGAVWYHAHGKSHFVYACDSLERAVAGARDLGITHESIFGVGLMSKFLEHLWQMTAEGT